MSESKLRLGEMERDALLNHNSAFFQEKKKVPETIDEAYAQFIESIMNDRNFNDLTIEQIKNKFTLEYYLDFRALVNQLGSVPMTCHLREV